MLSTEGVKCKLAGGVVLAVPTLFWVWVFVVLWRRLHPGSGARKAQFDEEEEEWVELEPSKVPDPEHYFEEMSSRRMPLQRQSSKMQRARSAVAFGVSVHFERTKKNMDADWTLKYSPLFEDFHGRRFAWSMLLAMMFKQYMLSIFLAFMVQAVSCDFESGCFFMLMICYVAFSIAVRPHADRLQRVLELVNTALEFILICVLILGGSFGVNIPGVSVIIIAAGIVVINIILRLQSLVVDRVVVMWEAIYPKASKIPVIGVVFRKIEQLRGTHKGNYIHGHGNDHCNRHEDMHENWAGNGPMVSQSLPRFRLSKQLQNVTQCNTKFYT